MLAEATGSQQLLRPLCSCGRRGGAEAMIATRDVQRGSTGTAVPRSLDEVREHLAGKDRETLKAVTSAGHHLGMLLQNLATAYDPGCIVLGGPVIELGAAFLQPALDVLNAHATFGSSGSPTARTSRFGLNAAAIGAAALVRYRMTHLAVGSSAVAAS